MAQADLFNINGNKVGTVLLSDEVFAVDVNEHVMHMAVVQYLANQRQGTKGTKTRSEVAGGGAKPRPQKGSGNSRQGSTRSPQWVGGGVNFAPKSRDYSFKLNKKVKQLALRSALTSQLANNNIIIVEDFSLSEIKTKEMKKILGNLNAERSLVVLGETDDKIIRSARNLEYVKTSGINNINTYDVLKYDKLVLTKTAVEKIQEVYA